MSTRPIHSELVEPTKSTAGFTIAELLIALAVMGILLAAVAVAFNASITNYRENEDIFKSINKARQALTRMTSQIRTAGWYNGVDKKWYTVSTVDPDNHNLCSLYITTGTGGCENITYEYRSADKKLYLITHSDGKEYVLCDNVKAMSFNRDIFLTTGPPAELEVKSVQISMTVESGSAEQTIAAAAVVRKNLAK
jgi:prepilin-type N-terminal cleavage/methylation domain-containing protein